MPKLENPTDNFGYFVAGQSVNLPLLQKMLVLRIQENGGRITKSELDSVSSYYGKTDMGTVNSLIEKNLIKCAFLDEDTVFTLSNDTLCAKDKIKVREHTMSAEELRDFIKSYLGKCGQSKLARILGVNPGTVRKWAQGVLSVPQHVLVFFSLLEHLKENGAENPEFI
jgi:DNA-binding transcriptional regulator YiaG